MNAFQSGLQEVDIFGFVLVTTFLLGMPKLKVNWKVNLPPKH